MRTSLLCAGLLAGALSITPAAQAQIDLSLEWERLGDSEGVLGQERGVASIESAEFSPDGTRIVSGAKRGGDLVLWTSSGQELWRRYHSNRAEIEVVAFTRDGTHLVSGGEDGFLRAWRVSDGAQVWSYSTNPNAGSDVSFDGLGFSNDGDRLAGGDEQGRLVVFDTSNPNPANWPNDPIAVVFQGPDNNATSDADINSVDWTQDDRFIVTAGRDGTVKRWEAADLNDADQGLRQTYTGFQSSIKSVRLSPDDQLIAAGGQLSPDGLVLVWDYATGGVVERIDFPMTKKIEAVEWTPNGRFLFTGGNEGRSDDAGLDPDYPDNGGFGPIRAFDRQQGFALVEEQVTFRQEYFHFDTDGDRLVSSSEDGGLRLWNVSYASPPSAQAPFGGTPAAVPGRIQAERFDEGGPGVAYEDDDAVNQGGSSFRDGEAVDVFASSNAGGGQAIGWIDDGEFLEFTVDVAQSGTYAVSARVATPQSGRDFRVEAAGGASAAVAVPNTGGWSAWQVAQGGELALPAGEQVVRFALTDGPFNLDWVEFALTDSPVTLVTTDARVSSSNSDAEETLSSGDVQLGSGDLDMATAGTPQVAGMRFALDVPQGATVTGAYVQFTAKEASSGGASLSIQAQASNDASAFSSASGDLTARPRTSAAVTWSPGAWALNASGQAQRTPDLSGLVQAVVNRSGWQAGNHLALLVDGSGKRSAWSYDGRAPDAPLLVVTYEAPGSARTAGLRVGAAKAADLVVFPNPAADRATVQYALPEAAAVTVSVYDLLGREVVRRDEGQLDAGEYEAALDVMALPAGLYVVRVRAGDRDEAIRLTIAR